jgi:orotate phosphoribosyltransferase
MDSAEVQALLESAGAIRHGHFQLSSGLHSATYVQCALVLQFPVHAERLGRALAAKLSGVHADAVVSPALGGVILGHEVARALGCRAMFTERDSSGTMSLRRGFVLRPNERVVVAEDVWTTGGSTCETIRVVESSGTQVVAAVALVDRGQGFAEQLRRSIPAHALLTLQIESYPPGECPLCKQGIPVEKPGSRPGS